MASVFQQVFQAQQVMQTVLLALPNVVGVAVGYKESEGVRTTSPALVVMVEEKKPLAALSDNERVPKQIDGVTTDVYEVGTLRAQGIQNPRSRFRPTIPGGVSIGHFKVTAGTLGVMVRDRTTGERFILSNNHVLANSNDALVGDAILQPSVMDGGTEPGDVVARLERFIPLSYLEDAEPAPAPSPSPEPDPAPPITPPAPQPDTPSGCDIVDSLVAILNLLASLSGSQRRVQAVTVTESQQASAQAAAAIAIAAQPTNVIDAALARPVNPAMFEDRILEIGEVTGITKPELGMVIRKYGRTSGLTHSSITLVNATVNVGYSTSQGMRTARFTSQVICDPMSQGGDSGALVVDTTSNQAVGLLFGGSPLATIFTPIEAVLNALNVDLG